MEKQLLINGSTIIYHLYGQGAPVMLVHGFGEKADVWKEQVSALQSRYSLIVPQLPGSGGSEPLQEVSMESMAEVLKNIFDAELEPGQKPILLGHSMGGYITLAFVEKYEDMLQSFGLIHSSCFADSDEKKETRKKGISFIRQHGVSEFLESTSPNLFSPDTKTNNPGLVKSFLAGLTDIPADTLIDYYKAMMARPDRSNILKNSSLPVLFVLGRHDTAIPLKDGLRQTTFPELSYIHVLEYSGHMGMLEEKSKLNEILLNFFQAPVTHPNHT
ncbi:MAG: alpha/beta hydrolase [Chitinophagaceae bacterium]